MGEEPNNNGNILKKSGVLITFSFFGGVSIGVCVYCIMVELPPTLIRNMSVNNETNLPHITHKYRNKHSFFGVGILNGVR